MIDWYWNWDLLRSIKSGDDSQTGSESSDIHDLEQTQTQEWANESTHGQTIYRRALLQTGLVALGFTGASGGGVSAATAPENGDTGKHPAVGAETGEVWSQQQTFLPDDGDDYDSFGSSVAVSPDYVFIGAPGDGAAYVFNKTGRTWSQQQRLTAADGDDGDRFGSSVAVSDSDGTALIGAPGDSNSNGEFAGAVYVYTEDQFTWSQQQKLTANGADEFGGFGTSIAISGSDDGTALISGGSPELVHVFTENGGTWSQQQRLTASDGDDLESFGASIAVSDSGDRMTALIGAEVFEGPAGEMDAGSAYVFTENGGTWSQQQRLTAADGDDGDRFGSSVAVSNSDETALIGAPADDNPNGEFAGSTYVFTENGETWSEQQRLIADDGARGDNFGSTAMISDDGTALIGAPDRNRLTKESVGSAYVFSKKEAAGELDLSVQAGTAPPGGTYTLTYQITNTGSTTIGDGDDNGPSINQSLDQAPPGSNTTEGSIPDGGVVDGKSWLDWTIAPGETLKANLEVELPGDIAPGEYEFSIRAAADFSINETTSVRRVYDRASGIVTVSKSDGEFDPNVHGFGFDNWAGTDGETFEGHDHQSLVEAKFKSQFNQEWLPVINASSWVSLPSSVATRLAGAMYETFSEAPDAVFSAGHCYGMCLLAKKYYEDGIPDALGDEIDSAADITKPTSKYSRIGEAIDTKHRSQFLDSTTMLEQIPYLAPNQAKNVEPIDVESEIQAIQSAIDQQGTALVGIGQHPVFGSAAHQLIGYNVRFENAESLSEADIAYIDAYDPNRPDNTPQQTLEVYLSEDAERTIADEYQDEMPLYDESGGYESGVLYQRFALIGQSRPDFAGQSIFTGVVIKDIIENYIGGYIEIVANSPVRINAAAPDGQKLLRPEAPVNGVPPSEYLYLTDPPVGEYEIEVEGTGDGSYAIDVKGSTVDGGVIEDSINGSITDGEVQTATVTMPETEEKDNINDVEVENVSLSPPTVDTSASQHTLSFVAKNVSTDGTADNFNITFPDGVTILIFSVENIDAESSNIVKEDSTFKFSLNPEGTNSTRDIPVSINVTMVADE